MDEKFDAFTMGFSNRTWDQTIDILHHQRIERLVDIRTLPGSRRTPQFNLENLQEKLPEAGIEYIHMKSLGGLRKPLKGLHAETPHGATTGSAGMPITCSRLRLKNRLKHSFD
jgi:hypothetical protein